ncbi:unnamed protein product [Acanthoscelides obtectus]|uniref:Uncharacterized protein n=1 Tax=Acanthoscelides obtectus TaxID=200917 RepID=A0A9P0NUJ2_ACAOB|nr:unnamed protein product [Acanthoscelides obtectus]CAK1673897.1 hypothetical protein AOBTE_LOCUS29470 [Acanthoscelides obtectus]
MNLSHQIIIRTINSIFQSSYLGMTIKRIIEGGGRILGKIHTFKSKLHDVYTEVINKISLAHHDDKRFIFPNTTKTLPWGHSDIEFYQTDPSLNVKYAIGAINDIAEGAFPENCNLYLFNKINVRGSL